LDWILENIYIHNKKPPELEIVESKKFRTNRTGLNAQDPGGPIEYRLLYKNKKTDIRLTLYFLKLDAYTIPYPPKKSTKTVLK
jgi:hypothetical protein